VSVDLTYVRQRAARLNMVLGGSPIPSIVLRGFLVHLRDSCDEAVRAIDAGEPFVTEPAPVPEHALDGLLMESVMDRECIHDKCSTCGKGYSPDELLRLVQGDEG
jgi:hypothetical protein